MSLRGQLLWTPSINTDVLFGLDYSRDRGNGECRNLAKLDVRPQERRGDAFIDDLKAIIAEVGNGDPRTCAQSLVQDVQKDVYGSLVTIDHDFGAVQLTSITAYREAEYDWLQELTGMDAPPGLASVRDNEGEESDQFSQELRLSRDTDKLFWVAGLYGIRENVDRFAFVPIQWGQHPDIPSGRLADRRWFQKAENTSYAVFGQLTWSFTDTLDLTLGGRQTWDEKKMDQKYLSSPDTVVYDLKGLSKTWSKFTGRVSLDWKVTDNHMLYATWSEGFKSGIFLSQSTDVVAAASTLDPEDATNIEVGAKTE